MSIRITSAQRCVLADCVRLALVGWLVTDPAIGQRARRLEHKATTILGFGFSRFATMTQNEFGIAYRPGSPVSRILFPLSIAEAAALANDIELELATDAQLVAAGILAAHSPYGQPEVCSRDWRSYVGVLAALGLSIDDDRPAWRDEVRSGLEPFRRAVAAASSALPVAAE